MIFVTDLPKCVTFTDMADFYETHIGTCQISIKRNMFKNFNHAYVMFESIDQAQKALDEFKFPQIKDGKMSRALPYSMNQIGGELGGKDVESTSIFIRGFEKMKWNHSDLYAKFCTFGKIQSCKVSIDA